MNILWWIAFGFLFGFVAGVMAILLFDDRYEIEGDA